MWSAWGSFSSSAVRPVRRNLPGLVVKLSWLVDKSEGT
jgi:hypothetical protein